MKKEYNFKNAKKVRSEKVDSKPKVLISLRLDPDLLVDLKEEAEQLGIGYQTLISRILKKHFDQSEALEDRIINKIMDRLKKNRPA